MPYKDPIKRREAGRERARRYYKRHADRCRRRAHLYRKANPEKVKVYKQAYDKTYRQTHTLEIRGYQRKYKATSRGKATSLRYQRSTKGKALHQAAQARIRAKRFNAPGSWTGVQFLALCKKYGNVCLCCHKKRRLTPDHVIPFCKGGTNHLSNIQPLCWPCNRRKWDRTTDYRNTKALVRK